MDFASYTPCRLCPRQCATDRLGGAPGVCGETAELRIASWGPHMGEEPCFTGTRGSGAIFFSGCACHCFFCQNWQISNVHGKGNTVSPEEFHRLALGLFEMGVHNLNFVTPDHFWPHIEQLCTRLRDEGVQIPFLFNSSGYQLPAMVSRYASLMDIFLPDFKFADPVLARTVMRDERYPEIALEALRLMVAEKGFLDPFDPAGTDLARRGVLVRHLVLPGHIENTLRVLEQLREEFGRWLPLSLMSQYTPVSAAQTRPPFDRPLSPDEYQTALDHAQHLGFENLLIQPLNATDDFLPDFDRDKPFPGHPVQSWNGRGNLRVARLECANPAGNRAGRSLPLRKPPWERKSSWVCASNRRCSPFFMTSFLGCGVKDPPVFSCVPVFPVFLLGCSLNSDSFGCGSAAPRRLWDCFPPREAGNTFPCLPPTCSCWPHGSSASSSAPP